MAYTAPTISAAGLTICTYNDILTYFSAGFLNAYGQTVYLAPAEPDYQMLSILALAASDCMQGLQLAYNQRSLLTAIGSGLDALGTVLGTPRKVASFSTALLTITGTPGTSISNGAARDTNGYIWQLPSVVVIPNSGSTAVAATCTTLGAVSALAGTISTISGGTAGWTGVTNAAAASPGQPVEADSQYRARLSLSTAVPSQTLLGGTQAAVEAVEGVTRTNIFANPTGSADANGTPAHSVTCVVEGGSAAAIAMAIYLNKGIGALTNGNTPSESGSTSYTITDPTTGQQQAIGFYTPTYVPIYVSLTIKGLAGYTSQAVTAITNALVSYLSALQIGEQVTYGTLWATSMNVMPSLNMPQFSITALTCGTSASPTGTTDIAMAFYQVAQCVAANIVITVSST